MAEEVSSAADGEQCDAAGGSVPVAAVAVAAAADADGSAASPASGPALTVISQQPLSEGSDSAATTKPTKKGPPKKKK